MGWGTDSRGAGDRRGLSHRVSGRGCWVAGGEAREGRGGGVGAGLQNLIPAWGV